MKIYILTDDKVRKHGLLAEHGLSIYIEHKGAKILFDAGQTDVYLRNATFMGINIQKADCIVLSHGHYDHCGGLVYFPYKQKFPAIYVHKDAFAKRYGMDGNIRRDLSVPWMLDDYPYIEENLHFAQKQMKIADSITLLGEIPGSVSFEGLSKGFYTENENETIVDMFHDEQMLVIETDRGLALFLGCSHPGIISCVQHAQNIFGGKNIYLLVAGMHMESVDSARLEKTIAYLMEANIQKIVPLHCTGIPAIAEMKCRMGERCNILYAGDILVV